MKDITSNVLLVLLLTVTIAHAEQQYRIDPNSQAETWETKAHGVTFSLTQIMPDQARAFYVNRGFTLEQIEPFAMACVYMTVLRNDDAPAAIRFRLADWTIKSATGSQPPLNIDDWLTRFKAESVPKPALIAFRWAQFPVEQEYEPGGDWNQGMLTTGLPPGTEFDVVARWQMENKVYEGVLRNVRCAK